MVKVRLSKYMVRNPVDVLEGYIGHRLSKESFLCIVAWTISLGGFIHGFIIAQSQRLLDNKDFIVVANESFTHFSLKFVSAFYVGEAVGAVISFIFMDELGRRNTQMAANLLCLLSLVCCSVTNLGAYLIYFQIVIGVCIGAQVTASVIYLAEVSTEFYTLF
ncbi:hypothetical protein EON65_10800 [archaeon]|nr:MAG: hypothetical protein EON65_10800 [archaeon]